MEITNKKDFTSAIILTCVWAILSVIFFMFETFIGAMFALSTVVSAYYVLAYYIKIRKEQNQIEELKTKEITETVNIDK